MARRSLPPLSFPPDADMWAGFLIDKLPGNAKGYRARERRVKFAANILLQFRKESEVYLGSVAKVLTAYAIRCNELEEMLKAGAQPDSPALPDSERPKELEPELVALAQPYGNTPGKEK